MESLIAITWWLRLLILAAGGLFIATLSLKLRELEVHPFREIIRLVHRPWFELAILLFFVGGLVQYGATKGTGGNDQSLLMMQMRGPAPAIVPIATDLTGFSLPTNFPSITNLCFWGIEPGLETVALGIAWPDTMSFTNDHIDIFGSHELASNGWRRLAQLDVSQIYSNAIVEFAYADLPTNAMRETAFYRLASQDDSDGDGLTDKVEEWVLGTDSHELDSDADGLDDRLEVDANIDPLAADSDGDGLSDGEEVGFIRKSKHFEWYDTQGFSTLYGVSQESEWGGIQSYFGAGTYSTFVVPTVLCGVPCSRMMVYDVGHITLSAADDHGGGGFPSPEMPLNLNAYSNGSFLIAPYWTSSNLLYGDPDSYIRTGAVASNSVTIIEFHDVRVPWYSSNRMTYQVIVPGGTGSVVRISYLSSDIWMDGEHAVVGVRNRRIVTTNGYYNLTWNFAERGPILPRTTIEYHLGTGTDAGSADSDGDGLSDDFEINVFHSNPLSPDEDGDGLSDADEYNLGTDPKSADSDGDGLPDKWEVDYGLCPTNSAASDGRTGDFDNDGLTNWQEYQEGCDPGNRDTDGDGVDDGEESTAGTNPLLPDSDYDGLSDSQELAIGTAPTQPDTDGDGMNDGWEWSTTFNPLVHNSNDSDPNNDYSADPDGDGLTNGQESDMGTNPNVADTDGDGVNDAAEVAQSSDPNDAADLGMANSRVVLPFYFGDHSGSHSEKYCLRLTPIAGSGIGTTPRTLSYVNANYGECETKTVVLVPGWKYEITLGHAGTNLTEGPDYDYTLTTTGNIPSNVIIEDNNSLFGMDETSTTFAGANKFATISIHAVTQVAVCAPDDSSWPVLEEGRVLLDNENLRIKVAVTPKLASVDKFCQMFGSTLTVKTSGTCPNGVQVPIGSDATLDELSGEIRIVKTRQQLKSLGLLPSNDDDSVNEMAWVDIVQTAGQSLADSDAFSSLEYAFRGKATLDTTKNLDSAPPNSQPSHSYMKAGGCEILTAMCSGEESDKRQIMNQADVFYYSGHGNGATGGINRGFTPDLLGNYWQRDLDCAVIAGCSVMNIAGHRIKSFGITTRFKRWYRNQQDRSVGTQWENTADIVFLGYCYTAPLDSQGAVSIASEFASKVKGGMGFLQAWKEANDKNAGRNACALDCTTTPHKFWYWDETSGVPVWTQVKKGTESW